MEEKIKVEMTWATAADIFIAALINGSLEGQRKAKEEIKRIARIADLGEEAVKILIEVVDHFKEDQKTGFAEGIYEEETTPMIQKIELLLDAVIEESENDTQITN